ncbi:MAG: nuclear transport factor 2 family protein [Bacteroidota bacterium]
MEPAVLIEKFYNSFAKLDAEEMVKCYSDEVEFEDPAFGNLSGTRAKNMWRMLCESQKGKDFQVSFSNLRTEGNCVKVLWEAKYAFSKTGRKVHNKIDASFEIENGKILKHMDRFNLRIWASQALGFKGALLGGTSFFRNKLQSQTNRLLDKFERYNETT